MQLLAERWVLTLALSEGECPYPTPLFYVLIEPDTVGDHAAPVLVFASSPTSHHSALIGTGPRPAAAAVYLETEAVAELRGAQLRGVLVREDQLAESARACIRRAYLARFPVAEGPLSSAAHQLYALTLTWAKLTDNRVRFGFHQVARFDGAWSEVKPSQV